MATAAAQPAAYSCCAMSDAEFNWVAWHRRHNRSDMQTGSVLALMLLLLVLMTATAVAVTRTATANTRLVASVQAGSVAFALAAAATRRAMQTVQADPTLLPGSGHVDLDAVHGPTGSARTRIRLLGTRPGCAALGALPAERSDYEIQVTATGTRGALSHHRQGFYVCREICTPPCTGMETPAQPTYWYQTRPDKP